MSGNTSYLTSGPSQYNPTSPSAAFPGCNIPQEDLDHAWALIKKYPPQIIVWIIRELLSQQPLDVDSFMIPVPLPAHTSSPNSESIALALPNLVCNTRNTPPFSLDSLCEEPEGFEATLNETEINGSATISRSPDALRGLRAANRNSRRRPAPNLQPIRKKDNTGQDEKRWFCVFDEHKDKSFGKRSDWKKHMNGFHEPGKIAWQCPEQDCRQIFVQDSNFCQHHRLQHACRKPCKHADSAKKRMPLKRAFACGYRTCQALLFSWDAWRDHVAHHMEDGMKISQWQYNTLLRNLLRRPEIHHYWEAHVAGQVFPYNIPARFNWRPRNTTLLKWQLEYNDEADLAKNAKAIALQAYETGLEVRSAQELVDPSVLIAEPIKQPSEVPTNIDLTSRLQHSDCNIIDGSEMHFYLPPIALPSQGLTDEFHAHYLPSATEERRNDTSIEQILGFDSFLPLSITNTMHRDIDSLF
ncbi:hypothetical protein AOQ84DRAFT_23831 [Glonium stellatum]|uniref:C2H2-type domain-containing protein n=1 Tax=Glonium stellatum TaxID=574774 RepID=A0A8E2JLL1_9PEZI|nr:hypothetical protein AOQ84DRAFT_23831 [Glonium stellatum]